MVNTGCRKGEAHIMMLHTGHEGRNGCYRVVGTETDGSAKPTPRKETVQKVENPQKVSVFKGKQLKLWA